MSDRQLHKQNQCLESIHITTTCFELCVIKTIWILTDYRVFLAFENRKPNGPRLQFSLGLKFNAVCRIPRFCLGFRWNYFYWKGGRISVWMYLKNKNMTRVISLQHSSVNHLSIWKKSYSIVVHHLLLRRGEYFSFINHLLRGRRICSFTVPSIIHVDVP